MAAIHGYFALQPCPYMLRARLIVVAVIAQLWGSAGLIGVTARNATQHIAMHLHRDHRRCITSGNHSHSIMLQECTNHRDGRRIRCVYRLCFSTMLYNTFDGYSNNITSADLYVNKQNAQRNDASHAIAPANCEPCWTNIRQSTLQRTLNEVSTRRCIYILTKGISPFRLSYHAYQTCHASSPSLLSWRTVPQPPPPPGPFPPQA